MSLDPHQTEPADGIKVLNQDAGRNFAEAHPRLAKEIEALGANVSILELRQEAAEAFLHVPSPIVLPGEVIVQVSQGQGLSSEMIGLGLLRTIELARPHGPSKLLADSLVCCAHSLLSVDTWFHVLPMILEAASIYDEVGEARDHIRACVTLAAGLLDSGLTYDVLLACDRAKQKLHRTEFCIERAALDYYQGVVCRLLGEHVEAERFLSDSLSQLQAARYVGEWKDRVRLERVRNYLGYGDNDKAMRDLGEWIETMTLSDEPEKQFIECFLMRARIHKEAQHTAKSLDDYTAAVRIACRDRRSSRSQLFRRFSSISTDAVFREAISAAVEVKRPDLAFLCLEASKTEESAIGLFPTYQAWKGEAVDFVQAAVSESQQWVQSSALELMKNAAAAVAEGKRDLMLECHQRAERLLGNAGFAVGGTFKKEDAPRGK